MAHLYKFIKKKRDSKHGNRKYTLLDMATIKHDAAVRNAQIKRGEVVPEGNNAYISVCGCGVEGCFIHGNFASVSPERKADWDKDRRPHHRSPEEIAKEKEYVKAINWLRKILNKTKKTNPS